MFAIVAADKNWGIGKDGDLLTKVPGDMKWFRETTMHKTIIMGRKTLESFPGGEPLKGRTNVVLTHDKANFNKEGCIVIDDITRIESELFIKRNINYLDTCVVGGGEIYRQLIPYCTHVYVTNIEGDYAADTFFPDLSALKWNATDTFIIYEDNVNRVTVSKWENPNPLLPCYITMSGDENLQKHHEEEPTDTKFEPKECNTVLLKALGINLEVVKVNPAKSSRTNTCVMTALAFCFDRPFVDVFSELMELGKQNYHLPNTEFVYGKILKENRWVELKPTSKDSRLLGGFMTTHKHGRYFIIVPGHAIAYINGVWYDTQGNLMNPDRWLISKIIDVYTPGN